MAVDEDTVLDADADLDLDLPHPDPTSALLPETAIITDPILLECLDLSNKARLLMHEMLIGLHNPPPHLQQSQPPPQPPTPTTPSPNTTTATHSLPTSPLTLTHPPTPAGGASDPTTTLLALQIHRSKQQKLLTAYLSQLKLAHRKAFMAAREAKQATTEKRQEVDRLHLQLQNLYYEQRHLRGEIASCRDFPHKYTHLPLLPLPDYLALFPDHASLPPHELMIARLYHEKSVREDLERQRKDLVAKKQALISENSKRQEDLAGLDEQLKRFIDSARPIQATFQKEY